MLSSRQFIKHEAQRKNVASRRWRFAARLLRRHVAQSAGRGERMCGGRSQVPSESEIHHLDEPVWPHHQVLGFDIAVDDTACVRGCQRARGLLAQMQHSIYGKWGSA